MTQKTTSPQQPSPRTQFTVPMFPHVRKFIAKTYGKGTIKSEEYTALGKAVTLALRDKRASHEHNDQYRDRLTATITIVLTKEQAELSPKLHKLIRINIDIDRIFKDHLITWINAQKSVHIPPYASCKMFLEHYNIDESEYSLDAAYRFYQRSKGKE